MKRYVASPYTYDPSNKPTSWGIWNTATNSWSVGFMPCKRERDAKEAAKDWNLKSTTL